MQIRLWNMQIFHFSAQRAHPKHRKPKGIIRPENSKILVYHASWLIKADYWGKIRSKVYIFYIKIKYKNNCKRYKSVISGELAPESS